MCPVKVWGPEGSLRKKLDFRWEALEVIVRGKSSIDTGLGFQPKNLDEVTRFLRSYGFDLEDPIEKAEIFGNFHEALNFIRKHFLQPENPDGLKVEMPRKVLELTDVRELFLMASLTFPGQQHDSQGLLLKNMACSVLKVMHTIAHIDKDVRVTYFAECQKQIFDRFYKIIHRDDEGRLFIGESADDSERIDLVAFETKPKKSRDSTLMKLLHKPENVAEDIFDRVGIRFVTHTCLDVLRVIKYLKDKMVLIPANIKPSRSRNTLVDLDQFHGDLDRVLIDLETKKIDEQTAYKLVEGAALPVAVNPENPHSSEFYRAVQFTCRQLIKFRNPIHDDLRELKASTKATPQAPEIQSLIDRIDLKHLAREVRFFYPYEVQLLDIQSHEENERGRSAHSEYKKAQALTALKRVMGPLANIGTPDGAR